MVQGVARSAAGARGTFALPEPWGALPHAELLSACSGTSAQKPKSSYIFHEFSLTCQFSLVPQRIRKEPPKPTAAILLQPRQELLN